MHYLAFNKNWFSKHQSKLIWLLNHRLTKRLFRHILCIENEETINRIEPNAYWFGAKKKGKQIKVKADFRTHDKYSKRLYFAFRPIWWAMHIWDLVVDKTIPKLSFGFSTLTAYPDAGDPGTTSVDGDIEANASSWATTRGASSGTHNNTLANSYHAKATKNSAVDWLVRRAYYLFDTSALTSGATISAGVFSLAGGGGILDNADSTGYDIVASTPASSTTIADSDFPNVGSTVFATIALSSFVTTDGVYNDFTLDSNGRANISQTSISKFAGRISRDTANSAPTGANTMFGYFADQAGTTKDPKLVVTYTISSPHFFSLLGVGA